eukprot:CAMPEP_0201540118 /NCGR_PEP_ID=MMETSP0161_2-20130828/70770_1 /ASSEMBLY_ACC=CAM_ASM_000251 /TAXON_ID=180227 /ORGANISM="Neoparamoeba aestuarina, Strain SoJaBio B1-5/56/2" /LENGTH=365 /DNA_ID=CAMNT_0047947565 /DNA_START=80 /DNA_END=1177 /DNA_ORIENTATION=-
MSSLAADCFYFLQGSCTKGSSCTYRHSSVALGNHTVCKFWLSNSCTNTACTFRHPAIPGHGVAAAPPPKDRSQTPCYWETQPSGCTKEDCPFLHINDKSKSEEETTPAEGEGVNGGGECGKEGEQNLEESLEELEDLEEDLEEEPTEIPKRPPVVVKKSDPPKIEKPPRKIIEVKTKTTTTATTATTVKKSDPPKIEKPPRKIIEVKTKTTTTATTATTATTSRFGIQKNTTPPPSQPAKFGVKSFQDILAQRQGGPPTTTTITPPQPQQHLKRRREETTVQIEQPKKIPKMMAETEIVSENHESNGVVVEELEREEEIVEAAVNEVSVLGESTDDLGLLDGDLDGDLDEDDLDDDELRKELLDL